MKKYPAWREKENPVKRRHRSAILFVGRKNGKTMMSALLALKELFLGDSGAEGRNASLVIVDEAL